MFYMHYLHTWLGVAVSFFIVSALGQASSCSTTLTPTKAVKPTIASGYRMALVATGLTSPRSIHFDTAGNLLVVQSGVGIANLAFQDDGGVCLTVKTMKTVVSAKAVRIALTIQKEATLFPRYLTTGRFVDGLSRSMLSCKGTYTESCHIAEPWLGCVSRWEDLICLITRGCLFLELRSWYFDRGD